MNIEVVFLERITCFCKVAQETNNTQNSLIPRPSPNKNMGLVIVETEWNLEHTSRLLCWEVVPGT